MPSSPTLRRVLLALLGILLLLVLLGGWKVSTFSRTFYPTPPVADFPPPEDLRASQLQDLEYFEHFLALDRSYSPEAEESARELLTTYREEAGRFSPAAFDLAVARIAALADNAHTGPDFRELARRHNRIPCRIYRFADGFYIVRARTACVDLLGGRVLAVNGRGIEGVVEELAPLVGGPRNRFEQVAAPLLLESPALLQAAGLAGSGTTMLLRVLLFDGSQVEIEIQAEPADQERFMRSPAGVLSPDPMEGEEGDWSSILTSETEVPLFLDDWETPFRTAHFEEEGILYVQLRSNSDEAGHPIGIFLDGVRSEAREVDPRAVVIDLRFNRGGDFTKTASFMKKLTDLAPSVERVFLLTGGWTFSAGITSAALAKEHGGDRVAILGEPVGDRLRAWGEGGNLTLPNSGLTLRFSTGLHDYTDSCFGEEGCFWTLFLHPMRVESLEPDIRASYTFDDYLRLRDPALERVLEQVRTASEAN